MTAVTLTACGGGSHPGRAAAPTSSGAPPTTSAAAAPVSAPVPELSFGLDAIAPTNWNVLSRGAPGVAPGTATLTGLTQVIDQVWPSVFQTGPDLNPRLDTTFVTAATQVSANPQTIVYQINPKAVWSDGTPITGADFVYTWTAQSGRPGATDVGRRPYTPASTAGYSQIRSVTASPSDPDRVTVVFATPDPDWAALFAPVIPAHVARAVGFDTGFTDPVADLVSGGPYQVVSYDGEGWVRLVRNPSYWGPPAAAPAIDFRFVADPAQIVTAIERGELSCAAVPTSAALVAPLRKTNGVAVRVGAGASYLDLDFNQVSGPMASATARAIVIGLIDRPRVDATVLAGIDPGAAAPANRFLVPGEDGYRADGPPPAARGAYHGAALRLVTGPDAASIAAAHAVAAQLTKAGVGVTVVVGTPTRTTAATSSTTGAASGRWDLAVEVRPISPFPGAALAAYTTANPANVDGFSNPVVDALVRQTSRSSGLARAVLIDRIDAALWAAHVDLPLVSLPDVVACQSGVGNVGPNPAPEGPAYDAQAWGVGGGAS